MSMQYLVYFNVRIAKHDNRYEAMVPKGLGEQLCEEQYCRERVKVLIGSDIGEAEIRRYKDRYVLLLPKELGEKYHGKEVTITIITTKPVAQRLDYFGKAYIVVPATAREK